MRVLILVAFILMIFAIITGWLCGSLAAVILDWLIGDRIVVRTE